ncbi:hypothetical protein JAAARDRAFT_138914, partial [Jaapia argillacea MUCL 33604]
MFRSLHQVLPLADNFVGENLSESDLAMMRVFALKVSSNLTTKDFNKLPYVFPSEPLPSLEEVYSRAAFLSGVKPVKYDCCVNSCICFVGPHAELVECPHCSEPRLNANEKPRNTFSYIPPAPRLAAMHANLSSAKRLAYRAKEHVHTPGVVRDVFDSHHFRSLKGKKVQVGDKELPYTYFEDDRDIALGLSTDGFAPFKRRKKT